MSGFVAPGAPLGVQTGLSVGASAVSLTVPAGATFALVTCETEPVRWRDDGVPPTASDGLLLPVTTGEPFSYASPKGLGQIKFIATTSSATLNVAYYGEA